MSSTIISTPRQSTASARQRPACESEAVCCIVSPLPQDGLAVDPLVFAAGGICRARISNPCSSGRPDRHMKTQVCIVGGGPAGMMLGYLLGRAGIDTCVLEKHADFLRDFRGDTVHPSTLQVMHELGLLEEFLKLPHSEIHSFSAEIGRRNFKIADFKRVPTACRFIAFMPQWDFLNFLARQGRRFPALTLVT